jgi:hypothetical protein
VTWAAPYFLAALAILLPVLITFLVRKQKRVMRVPSTMLWRLGAKSISKSKRIRDVRRLVALLACLAAVALLALAAARPGGKRGTSTVYVVDVSASMAGAPMDDAKRFLMREVTALGPNGRIAIITAGTEPKIVLPPSPPGPLVDRAIHGLSAEKESASVDEAMALAEGLHAHVIVISDHAVDKEASHGGWTEQKLFERSAKTLDNLGITSLYTKTAPDARDDEEREATIVVATSSNVPRKARVKVTFNGKTLSDRTVDLTAKGEATENVTIRGAGKLVARVSSDDGKSDALAIDDEAALEEAARKPPHVALVRKKGDDSAAYFFVSRALAAAGVTEIDDVDVDEPAPTKAEVAVVLKEGTAHPKNVPSFFIGATSSEMQLTTPPLLVAHEKAHLRSIATEDPIMRGVSLDEMTTLRATVLTPPHGARSLVDLDGGPAMVAGGSGMNSWVWLGIDPEASDLVLRVAFPVLVGNVLSHLSGASTVVSAKTSPRDEVMLAALDAEKPLETAASPRWRMPLSPPAFMAVMAGLLLAFEAWWSFRRQKKTA